MAGYKGLVAKDTISRAPATDDEIKEISARLASTQTKATKPAPCRSIDELKEPGSGLKMLPVIPGIEERFRGPAVEPEKTKEAAARLHTTRTKAWQAQLDNHRILLYPERTLLMNNVERIAQYQQNGAIAKQTVLARREKWYN